MSEITKETKQKFLGVCLIMSWASPEIVDAMRLDIEDAETYRKKRQEFLALTELYQAGQKSCAASEWCYDLEKACLNVMYIVLDPTYVRGWARGLKSAVNGQWYDGIGNKISPIAFATINLPEEKP